MQRPVLNMAVCARCRTGEFWIACDFCDTWYDGKCVQVRPLPWFSIHVVSCDPCWSLVLPSCGLDRSVPRLPELLTLGQ